MDRHRSAFSISEILIVAAVVAVLASLLLPQISALRRQAKSAHCAGRQAQLFIALRGYADDHRNLFVYLGAQGQTTYLGVTYPPAGGQMWYETLADYVGERSGGQARERSLWDCPQFRSGSRFLDNGGWNGANMVAGIAIIETGGATFRSTKFVHPDHPDAGKANYKLRWSEFAPMSQRIIAGDTMKEFLQAQALGGANQPPYRFVRAGDFFYGGAPARHSHPARTWGGPLPQEKYLANYLHADGHVERLGEVTAAHRAYHRSTTPPP